MKLNLPSSWSKLADFLVEQVGRIEAALPGVYAFAFVEENLAWNATVHRSETTGSSADRGVVFRALFRGVNFERALNDLEPSALSAAVEGLIADVKKRAPESGPSWQAEPWAVEDRSTLPPSVAEQLPPSLKPQDLVVFTPEIGQWPEVPSALLALQEARRLRAEALALEAEWLRAHADQKPLPFVMANIRLRLQRHLFVDRERRMAQILPLALAVISGQSEGGHAQRALAGGVGGWERLTLAREDFEEALFTPRALDKARRLEPGRYAVITGPDVTGVVAHEAFGHTQEGDTIRQGRSISPWLRRQGPTGNAEASIANDPALFEVDGQVAAPNASYYFDHEGRLARPTWLIHRGQLGDPMTDLLSAVHLGVPRTANGKRESWRRPTLTRQTNTYFTPGSGTLQDLIARVPRGFLARHSHGGMEDPKGANLTAGTEYLEEIRDGRLTGEIFLGPSGGHIELAGYVPDMLLNIVAKSGNASPSAASAPLTLSGGCGKFHKEYVMAGCGGTYILWKELTAG